MYSLPQFNANGNYVLYPSFTADEPRIYLILYNINSRQIIHKYKHQSMFDVGPPIWNHQGNQFFYVYKSFEKGHVTFALGDIDGEYTEVAILQRELTSYDIRDKVWSSDGRYVVVFIDDYSLDYNTQKLIIFDLLEQKIMIPNFRVNINWDQEIVWSPDSTKLLIENYPEDNSNQHKNQVILFDLETLQAGILMKDTKVFGWVPAE
ncbi:MAG: hypothetical protein JEZ00_00995 [Anaerolineaceae bacterium]|nr:hypothetical protein [Anaerolineaceae bacterium]